MILTDIPAHTDVFIDANVLVYAFAPDPVFGPPCHVFLERIKNREIGGTTSSHVFSNVGHRLMTLEACATFSWPYQGIANRLKKNPAQVSQLSRFKQALDEIIAVGIRVLAVDAADIIAGASCSNTYGLLGGDASIVAAMRRFGIVSIASNDVDFDRVPSITRYRLM